LASSSSSPNTLTPSDIDAFLQDLTRRFEPDNEIDDVLGPVVRQLLFHESLFRPEGLGGGDAGWRGVVSGLEALVSNKAVAVMITRMEDWNPPNATAASFEHVSLLGPLCRLGIFGREWVRELLDSGCAAFDTLSSQASPKLIFLTLTRERALILSLRMPVYAGH
jgi:ubiquitin conjugation factor E4 B